MLAISLLDNRTKYLRSVDNVTGITWNDNYILKKLKQKNSQTLLKPGNKSIFPIDHVSSKGKISIFSWLPDSSEMVPILEYHRCTNLIHNSSAESKLIVTLLIYYS